MERSRFSEWIERHPWTLFGIALPSTVNLILNIVHGGF